MYKIYIAKKDRCIGGKKFPKDTVYALDENGLIFACVKYPKMYQGKNPRLELYIYDSYTGVWTWGVYQDQTTMRIHDAYIFNNRQHPNIGKNNYVEMMKHSRKHKKTSGGMRENIDSITDYSCSVSTPYADFGRAVR